jgi:hypothetical protein
MFRPGRVHARARRAQAGREAEKRYIFAPTACSIRCNSSVHIIHDYTVDPSDPPDRNPGLLRAWEQRVEEVQAARSGISELRESGKGMQMDGSRGTFWGVLNAVLEYVDHHREVKGSRLSYALLGDGMDLKVRAFKLVQEHASKAA